MRLLKDYFCSSVYLSQILALGGAVDRQLVQENNSPVFSKHKQHLGSVMTFSVSQVVSIKHTWLHLQPLALICQPANLEKTEMAKWLSQLR